MILAGALLLAIAVAVAAWAVLGFPTPTFIRQDELGEILRSLDGFTYAVAGGMTFLELGTPIGLIAPSELAAPFAGAAAAAGSVSLIALVCVVWICAVAGDSANYLAGKVLGRRAVERYGPRLRITEARLRRVDGWFASHGTATVMFGRFAAYLRTLTPFLAGAARMPYSRFLAASIAGSSLWAAALCGLGYVAFHSLTLAADIARWAGIALALAALLAVIAAAARAHRRRGAPSMAARPGCQAPLRAHGEAPRPGGTAPGVQESGGGNCLTSCRGGQRDRLSGDPLVGVGGVTAPRGTREVG
jgi:membrane-associated protein